MILSITTTHQPATDLGFLLHKNPTRAQSFNLAFGWAHIAYSEVGAERCTANLLLEIDPVALVRGSGLFDQYVNDRPYVASSFLSVALVQVLREALAGRSRERQDLAETPIPLELRLFSLPVRGGEVFLRALFEPLGYELEVERLPLDARFPVWGMSSYYNVALRITAMLSSALSHLYVLIPVLDDDKHYFVGDDEVQKLLRFGSSWLATHPAREDIARRYLKHQRALTRSALAQLEPEVERDATDPPEKQLSLHATRLERVRDELRASGAKRVLDLGCGEGKLMRLLLEEKAFEYVLGADVSSRALEMATERLKLPTPRAAVLQSSLTYRDSRLRAFDAVALVEVIEHLEPHRLNAVEKNVFDFLEPSTVIVTTPNAEFNSQWANLPAGQYRHSDHRFEWTRAEFGAWAERIASSYGYQVRVEGVGLEVEGVGAPSQMAVFSKSKDIS
jgi:3' terminal RNA ribose 2'-O-methyltransferase Hen1